MLTKRLKEDEIQQMNLFGEAKSIVKVFMYRTDLNIQMDEKLGKEKEFLGFYFSAHPLDKYKDIIEVYKLNKIARYKRRRRLSNL